MFAFEVLASLDIEVDTEYIAELDEQLAAADEIAASEGATRKLVLLANGEFIQGRFSSGFSANGPADTAGSGAFAGSELAPNLFRNYILEIGHDTAKLYEGNDLIWSGTGRQKGITGSWRIQLTRA